MDAQEFYLIRTLNVVGFDAGGKGYIHQLPTGTMLTKTGRSSLPGFIEIMHDGKVSHTFEKDFRDRSLRSNTAFAATTA